MAKEKNKEPQKERKPEAPEQNAPAQQPPETPAEAAPEETELAKLQKEFEEHKQQHLRVLAEYDNFRKRTQNEKNAIYNNAVSDTVQALLPVADNIERALGQENASAEDMRKGVEMIENQIQDCFEKLGLVEMGRVGENFDPNSTTLWLTLRTKTWARTSSRPCTKRAISWGTGWSATPWYRWQTKIAHSKSLTYTVYRYFTNKGR